MHLEEKHVIVVKIGREWTAHNEVAEIFGH